MPLLEFDIIRKYFSDITTKDNSANIHVGIGDDAAIVSIPENKKLVVCTDTLNEGVHFPSHTSAYDIAYKALAVNLSDLAAMGAMPKWFTLNLSLPEVNKDWLADFSKGLQQLSRQYQLNLIGGDTTRGALSISITLAGHVDNSQALLRSGAKVGDKVYLSGCTGEAAYGLACLSASAVVSQTEQYFVSRLNQPTARVNLGLSLLGVANACIDISDGLVADVTHIAESSQCGIELDLNAIPLPAIADKEQALECALSGGDDYELAFTVALSMQAGLKQLIRQTDLPITCIGEVVATPGVQLLDNGRPVDLPRTGYEHFK
ncbi:Thiamine-monophosphate kinase [hydrothermal vent metagenome]|uniref:Thiamine-monophosphate kinase n=1 Tax=hydrothermal vent metagenome TaxID=652676 RepID=A0A3B0ZZC9_9ZZZZ